MNMKKKFEPAEIEMLKFDCEDILCTSSNLMDRDPDNDGAEFDFEEMQ